MKTKAGTIPANNYNDLDRQGYFTNPLHPVRRPFHQEYH